MKLYLFVLAFLCAFVSAFAAGAVNDSAKVLDAAVLKTVDSSAVSDTLRLESGIPQIKRHDKSLPGIIPFAEVLALNVVVWAYDRYITQADYAKVNPSIWKRNLHEGWEWDDNHWGINFYGHPYQGVYYYGAARSAGFDFYSSFLFTLLGSWEWEHFGEREYPAPNDLVTTSVGGALYGEMLFRLQRRLVAKPDPTWMDHLESFVLHPLSYVHWRADGIRPNDPGYMPLQMNVAFGGGYRFGGDYRYDVVRAERQNDDWKEFYGFGDLSVEYGDPDRKVKHTAEYFTVDIRFENGQHTGFFNMDASAKLYSFHQSDHKGFWTDVAPTLNFDTYYGDLVEMGNLSLGLRLDLRFPLAQRINLRYITEPGFLFFGSTDFCYDEYLEEIDEEYEFTRDYQYNYGAKMRIMTEVDFFNRVFFRDQFVGYLMKTMPGTEPHYGASGYDIVGTNQLSVEARVTNRVNIGAKLDIYFKVSAYTGDDFEPMSRMFQSVGIYNRVFF